MYNDDNQTNSYQDRYSYGGYYNRDASELYGQRLYPETIGASPSAREENPNQKKQRKAPRIIAAVLGITMLAAGAGAGGAMYVLNQQMPAEQPAAIQTAPASVTQTVVQGTSTDISAVAAKSAASVVEITTRSPGNPFAFRETTGGAGSGVIYSEDGYIVTNNHVVSGTNDITVITHDGEEYEATLIGTDEQTDLAVIKIEANGLQAVSFADSDSIQVGQLAVAIGNPLGELGGTVTSGIISATGREITIDGQSMHLLQTSAAVNPGNSGGGLFDQDGNLVGIVNAKSSGVDIEGLGFAIPSNTVKGVADELIGNGYVTGRPQLGISVIEVSDPYALARYRLKNPGVYIASDNNPAGLMAGDRIVSIDGAEIDSASAISAVLSQHQVGDTLALVVERGGEEVQVDITLTEQVPEGLQTPKSEI